MRRVAEGGVEPSKTCCHPAPCINYNTNVRNRKVITILTTKKINFYNYLNKNTVLLVFH